MTQEITVDQHSQLDALVGDKLGFHRILVRKELKLLRTVGLPAVPVNLATAFLDKKNGLLVLTESRLMFVRKSGERTGFALEDVRLPLLLNDREGGERLTFHADGGRHKLTAVLPLDRAGEIVRYLKHEGRHRRQLQWEEVVDNTTQMWPVELLQSETGQWGLWREDRNDWLLRVSEETVRTAHENPSIPALLGQAEGDYFTDLRNNWWWYEGRVWLVPGVADTPDDVAELVKEQGWDSRREEEEALLERAARVEAERKRQQKLAWAQRVLDSDAPHSGEREPIPTEVRYAVFQRDGGRCVDCDSSFDLQYDHVIPLAMGGSSSEGNLQLLCGACNRRKGATLG